MSEQEIKKFSKWCEKINVKVSFNKKIHTFETVAKKFPVFDNLSTLLIQMYHLNYILVQNNFKISDYIGLLDLYNNPQKYNNTVNLFTIDPTQDTNINFRFTDPLPYYTATLIKALNKPKKTGKKNDIHTYEWKILLKGSLVSIFDWVEDGETNFEDKTWYIAYNNKKDIKEFLELIDTFTETETTHEDDSYIFAFNDSGTINVGYSNNCSDDLIKRFQNFLI